MRTRHRTRLIREGKFIAEVAVELIDTDEGWSPYLSPDDAQKLDDVREALRRGDIKRAAQNSHVYELKPLTIRGIL